MHNLRVAWIPLALVVGCERPVRESPPTPAPAAPKVVAVAKTEPGADCCEIDRTKLVAMLLDSPAAAGDWPLFGGTPQRNMANVTDKGIPTEWSVEEGKQKNVKWSANLGSKAYGGPVVAGGMVFVGTTNSQPRDPAVKGTKAVLMAFSEADGKFLWQIPHDYPPDDLFKEAAPYGLFSTPAVDGQRLYYVTPGCEVICAGFDGKIQWRFDMMKQLKVVPYHTANCSPLVAGDLVVVVTGNGTNDAGKVVSPKAPSFVAFHKTTGKIAWQSDLPSATTLEGQWSNPALAKINGKNQVILPGGDAYLYGLELETGKPIWKFNCQPERGDPKDDDRVTPNYMVATPVVHDNKVYIGLGVYPEHPSGSPFSHVLCVDATKAGDVSPKSLNHKDAKNNGSALVWSYGGKIDPVPKKGRRVLFGRTISTCAIHDGLVYIAEEQGYLHCLDAKTGQKYWDYDFKAGVWGSAFYVDGKVYIGTEDGEVVVFKAGKQMQVLAKNDMHETVHSTPVVARGVMYVATKSKLYAIAATK